tara:strand:+ start:506 stop:1492 length:987 start_codon:yes stop_codon:yes gene_type:complete
VDYKLTTPYLIERKLSKQELKLKSREFGKRKDIFVRKAETSVNLLQKQSEYLKNLRSDFSNLSKKFNIEMDAVKHELSEISRYEEMRHRLREELRLQREQSHDNVEDLSSKLDSEKRDLKIILEGVEAELQEINKEKEETQNLEQKEEEVIRKIEDIKSMLNSVEKRAKDKRDPLKYSLERINGLSDKLIKIKSEITDQRDGIDETLDKSIEHKKNIENLQTLVLKKLKDNEEKLKNARSLGIKIKTIFEKKASTTDIFDTMDKNRAELQLELKELIKKAKGFQLSSKSKEAEKHILGLEKKFDSVTKKISVFEDMYRKLISVTKGKK